VCSAENLHTFHERPLLSLEVGAWCAVPQKTILGPVFFRETITVERYKELTMNFVSLLDVGEHDCWFQQDGVAAGAATSTMQMPREFFGGCIIALNLWPPRSPDIFPLVLCLWGGGGV
jgi:hypothetical protein